MRKGLPIILVLLGLLLLGGCMSCNIQKTLVQQDEAVKKEWAEVQNQYQRRADLIDNLVATVKGAANHEKSTLEAVIKARAEATKITVDPTNLTPEKLQEFQAAQGQLSQALGRLMVVQEQYPDIKANQNFLDLQAQIEGTENRITVARKNFNDAVQAFNTTVRTWPNAFIAGYLGFKEKPTFSADEAAQKAPKVNFE